MQRATLVLFQTPEFPGQLHLMWFLISGFTTEVLVFLNPELNYPMRSLIGSTEP